MISKKVLNDKQAISVAEAIATANEATANIFHRPMRIMIEEETTESGVPVWRINYLPVTESGLYLRGGDYTVEVNATDGTIHQTFIGQ